MRLKSVLYKALLFLKEAFGILWLPLCALCGFDWSSATNRTSSKKDLFCPATCYTLIHIELPTRRREPMRSDVKRTRLLERQVSSPTVAGGTPPCHGLLVKRWLDPMVYHRIQHPKRHPGPGEQALVPVLMAVTPKFGQPCWEVGQIHSDSLTWKWKTHRLWRKVVFDSKGQFYPLPC